MSRERIDVARYEARTFAAGMSEHLDAFSADLAGKLGVLADDEAQRKRNAQFILRVVGSLPTAKATKIHFSGSAESSFRPNKDTMALLLLRTTVQHGTLPYYIVGAQGRSALYVRASSVLTRHFVDWAKEEPDRHSRYKKNAWTSSVAPGVYPARYVHRARPARGQRGLPTPQELLAPANEAEVAQIHEAKKSANRGLFGISVPEWQGRKKFELLEDGISSADMEGYEVIGRLLVLSTLFGKHTQFMRSLDRYQADMPVQRGGSEPLAEHVAHLEANLVMAAQSAGVSLDLG